MTTKTMNSIIIITKNITWMILDCFSSFLKNVAKNTNLYIENKIKDL